MATRVRVGDVEVRVEADLTPKQLRALLKTAAGIHLGIVEASGEQERPPMGFTVITERAPEEPEYVTPDDD